MVKATGGDDRQLLLMSGSLQDCFGRRQMKWDDPAILAQDMEWLGTLAYLKPESFQFDGESRVWKRKPDLAPDTDSPAPTVPQR
jgi:hypothetical protein